MTVSIPHLETPRLRLREYRMDDFDGFAAHMADEATGDIRGGCDRRGAFRIFGCQTGMWLLSGAGWWAVELRETGEVVGAVGAFFREGWPEPEMELGWNTYRASWGKGFATEAATAMVRYAFAVRHEPRVIALIDAKNTASLRVASRLGFAFESEADLFGKPVGRYVLGAPADARTPAPSTPAATAPRGSRPGP